MEKKRRESHGYIEKATLLQNNCHVYDSPCHHLHLSINNHFDYHRKSIDYNIHRVSHTLAFRASVFQTQIMQTYYYYYWYLSPLCCQQPNNLHTTISTNINTVFDLPKILHLVTKVLSSELSFMFSSNLWLQLQLHIHTIK